MSSTTRELRGVLPVFQTPYHPDETIDHATLEREIAWLHDCGAHGIVMAMVSETLRLSSEERRNSPPLRASSATRVASWSSASARSRTKSPSVTPGTPSPSARMQ